MKHYLLTTLFCLGAATASQAQFAVDPALASYKETIGVAGDLNSIGSHTLSNLMTLWAERFIAKYPEVNCQIEGEGGATAPTALIAGNAQLGPMNRPMNKKEIDLFAAEFGYKPLEIKVAIDALAVYVHKDNPVKGLTLRQVDAIFSSTRKRGGEDVTTWDQVGVDRFKARGISLHGRNSASGASGFFKWVVLETGDFKDSVKEQPGSSAVVKAVGEDEYGTGYSGVGYKTDAVRYVPLGSDEGKFVELNQQNCLNGSYPLARFLYIYVNKKPGQPLDKLTGEFLKFVVSKEGQEVVAMDGYIPLSAGMSKEMIKLIE
jgi:phosphate transport system substrate-binding protein